jgi:hypothetical protein
MVSVTNENNDTNNDHPPPQILLLMAMILIIIIQMIRIRIDDVAIVLVFWFLGQCFLVAIPMHQYFKIVAVAVKVDVRVPHPSYYFYKQSNTYNIESYTTFDAIYWSGVCVVGNELDGVQQWCYKVQLAIGHRPDFRDSISIMNEGMNFRVSIRECGTPCHACQVKSGVRES